MSDQGEKAGVADENPIKDGSILIVDDRRDKLLALETVLQPLSRTIVKAESGAQALRILLKEEFAVILLDVSMPGMDGFETASLIRLRANTEHTPIIFVTSINVSDNHVSRGYSLGAVDYIFSPIEPEILRAKVTVFLDLYEKTLKIKAQAQLLQNRAEQRADSLEHRLHDLLDRLNVGIFRSTVDGELLEANPAFRSLVGIEDGRPADDPHVRELVRRLTSRDRSTEDGRGTTAHEVEITTCDGDRRFVSVGHRLTRDFSGALCLEGMVEDITERKLATEALNELNDILEQRVRERTEALELSQANLRRSERLAALGTLAAGIAHEINNPLNSILMAAQYALRANHDPSVATKSLEAIVDQTKRCGRIIRSVLQFAKDEKRPRAEHDINEIIRQAIELISTYVKTPLTVDLELCACPMFVVMDTTEIEQVVINIVQNAALSAGRASRVTITSRPVGDGVRVSITDDGPGIPPDILHKIFDPFFSTRSTEGGSGLGLSVVHGIVSDHGGSIFAESTPGSGATFHIDLPLHEALAKAS